jgi:uncharacterized protein (DUF305 family)
MKKLLALLITTSVFAQIESENVTFMNAMNRAMTRMDEAMSSAPMNGDPDDDFATMMIPHHQGAIEMAKVELKFGKDPVLCRLAQEILVDQQSEIDAMRLWLEKNAAHRAKKGE